MDLRDPQKPNSATPNSPTPIDATVMVLTHNSEATLERALTSVGDFAEIIICDGQSTDATIDIAREHGAIVLSQDSKFTDDDGRLLDYAGARHQVVQHATKPWILHLDADEIATPELVRSIAELDRDEPVSAFRCGARHIADGKTIRSAANYPMSFMRVFRRDAVTGYFGPINEHPEFADDAVIDRIDGEFLIPMPPLRTVLRKWARYQRIVASDAFDAATSGPTTPDTSEIFASDIRTTKWLAWRIWKSRATERGPHMPLRYDVARVGFHLTMAFNRRGARTLAHTRRRLSIGSGATRRKSR